MWRRSKRHLSLCRTFPASLLAVTAGCARSLGRWTHKFSRSFEPNRFATHRFTQTLLPSLDADVHTPPTQHQTMLRLKVHDSCALPERETSLPRAHDEARVGPMSLNSACKMAFLGRRHSSTVPKVVDNTSGGNTKSTTRRKRRSDPVVTAALLTAVVASMDGTERMPETPSDALTTVLETPEREDRAGPRQQQRPTLTRRPSSILRNGSKERPTLAAAGRQISFGRNIEITIDLTTIPSAHSQAQETRHHPESHNRWRGLDLVRSDSMPRVPTRNLEGPDRPPLVRCHSVPLSKRNAKNTTGKSKRRLESV